jgi:hypothetical protein
MEYWIIIPMFLFFLALAGTNFEIWRLRKEILSLKKVIHKRVKK